MTRPLIAVFGANRIDERVAAIAEDLGRRLVDAGFRLVCGGLGGVMAAVACGARSSTRWTGSEVVALLPGWTKDEQPNPWVDVALATGMGSQRNNLVARVADAAIAIGGAAGTLSEIALAWHEGRPLACIANTGGWASRLAGERLDERRDRPIVSLSDGDAAVAWLDDLFPRGVWPERMGARWWAQEVPRISRVDEGRLRALAEDIRAWNRARGQQRRALVTFDGVDVVSRSLITVVSNLPELQPVVFVTDDGHANVEELRDAGWLIGLLGPGNVEADVLAPALLAARRRLLATGGIPWLAWPAGCCSSRLRALARGAGFALQFGHHSEQLHEPGLELVHRTPWGSER